VTIKSNAEARAERDAGVEEENSDTTMMSINVPAGLRTQVRHGRSDRFSAFAERMARLFGTGKYIFWQTVVLLFWIGINVSFTKAFDPYPFKFLNLVFSTQAAYAAPLILLAQWRQAARERQGVERDRQVALRTTKSTRYLISELSSSRLSLIESLTIDDLERKTQSLIERLERVSSSGFSGDGEVGKRRR
jgi:uncharacterized membrane protein